MNDTRINVGSESIFIDRTFRIVLSTALAELHDRVSNAVPLSNMIDRSKLGKELPLILTAYKEIRALTDTPELKE